MTSTFYEESLKNCNLCNRHCSVNRLQNQLGFCMAGKDILAARAALHYYEEPCISGINGSGAVFFSGCSLKCVFCQNHDIALAKKGISLTPERLSDVFLKLQDKGAHNINLVTGTHFIPQIAKALSLAKSHGLTIPIVYNTGAYETIQALSMLDGLIDIYLPDLKYFFPETSDHYVKCMDYFSCATVAIAEMFRQVGTPQFVSFHDGAPVYDLTYGSEHALMTKGMIVRHLLLPGHTRDARNIIKYLSATYGDSIFISLMNQYTPMECVPPQYPKLHRRVTAREYNSVIDYALTLNCENIFIQEGNTANSSFIPAFNYEGLLF